jgi:hypothetical protein
MLLNTDCFFQMDKNVAVFSTTPFYCLLICVLLHYQMETEPGNAGEQPVRDTFDVRRKCQIRKGFQEESPFDIFRVLYALKNSSINLFFRVLLSPL